MASQQASKTQKKQALTYKYKLIQHMNQKLLSGVLMAAFIFTLALPPAHARVTDNLTDEQKAEAEAAADAAKDEAAAKAQAAGYTFDDLQEVLENILDVAIEALETAEDKINANPYLTDATKSELTDGLNEVEGALEVYAFKLQSITTLEELEALTDEVKTYLKTNESVIKEAIEETVYVLLGEAQKTMQVVISEIESAYLKMKRDCPEEAETFASFEATLNKLDIMSEDLKGYIEDEDAEAAKALIEEMKPLLKSAAADLQTFYNSCY